MHMWLPQHSLFLFLIPSGQFLLAALNEFPQLGHCEQPDSWLILGELVPVFMDHSGLDVVKWHFSLAVSPVTLFTALWGCALSCALIFLKWEHMSGPSCAAHHECATVDLSASEAPETCEDPRNLAAWRCAPCWCWLRRCAAPSGWRWPWGRWSRVSEDDGGPSSSPVHAPLSRSAPPTL